MQTMQSRTRFDWKLTDLVYNFLVLFKPSCCLRKQAQPNIHSRYELFKKGEAKLMKEFDAIYFAKSMRNLNMIIASMMDDSERFMASYQKVNALNFDGDMTDSHSDDVGQDIPKMFEKSTDKEQHTKKISEFMVSVNL
jgi:hypothetical protein